METHKELKRKIESLEGDLEDWQHFMNANQNYLTPSQVKLQNEHHHKLTCSLQSARLALSMTPLLYVLRKKTRENFVYIVNDAGNGMVTATPVMSRSTHEELPMKIRKQHAFKCSLKTLRIYNE